ncbi:MAG: hypothetical protein AAF533_26955 [Acidobacteriota bacterium]
MDFGDIVKIIVFLFWIFSMFRKGDRGQPAPTPPLPQPEPPPLPEPQQPTRTEPAADAEPFGLGPFADPPAPPPTPKPQPIPQLRPAQHHGEPDLLLRLHERPEREWLEDAARHSVAENDHVAQELINRILDQRESAHDGPALTGLDRWLGELREQASSGLRSSGRHLDERRPVAVQGRIPPAHQLRAFEEGGLRLVPAYLDPGRVNGALGLMATHPWREALSGEALASELRGKVFADALPDEDPGMALAAVWTERLVDDLLATLQLGPGHAKTLSHSADQLGAAGATIEGDQDLSGTAPPLLVRAQLAHRVVAQLGAGEVPEPELGYLPVRQWGVVVGHLPLESLTPWLDRLAAQVVSPLEALAGRALADLSGLDAMATLARDSGTVAASLPRLPKSTSARELGIALSWRANGPESGLLLRSVLAALGRPTVDAPQRRRRGVETGARMSRRRVLREALQAGAAFSAAPGLRVGAGR